MVWSTSTTERDKWVLTFAIPSTTFCLSTCKIPFFAVRDTRSSCHWPRVRGSSLLSKKDVMLTFCVHLMKWGNPADRYSIIWGVSVRGLWETSLWIDELSKEDSFHQCTWTLSNLWWVWTEWKNRKSGTFSLGRSFYIHLIPPLDSSTAPGSWDMDQNLYHRCPGSWSFGLRLQLVPWIHLYAWKELHYRHFSWLLASLKKTVDCLSPIIIRDKLTRQMLSYVSICFPIGSVWPEAFLSCPPVPVAVSK